jgi:hypothetical protein
VQRDAWEGHRAECKALKALGKESAPATPMLLARIVWRCMRDKVRIQNTVSGYADTEYCLWLKWQPTVDHE